MKKNINLNVQNDFILLGTSLDRRQRTVVDTSNFLVDKRVITNRGD